MSVTRVGMTGAWVAAFALLCVGCTDLKASHDDTADGGDASTSQGRGGSGGNRGGKDGGPNAHGDRDGGDDAGPAEPSTPSDSADDPAAVAGAGLQLQCADKASACVAGGIISGGADITRAGSAMLPGGGTVTLSDDGFELGATTCDVSGKQCVTGGIAP
jgi:hypothetical protein